MDSNIRIVCNHCGHEILTVLRDFTIKPDLSKTDDRTESNKKDRGHKQSSYNPNISLIISFDNKGNR